MLVCLYMCVWMCIYVMMFVCTATCEVVCVNVCLHVCVSMCDYYELACAYVCLRVWDCLCVFVHVCCLYGVCACMLCVRACVYWCEVLMTAARLPVSHTVFWHGAKHHPSVFTTWLWWSVWSSPPIYCGKQPVCYEVMVMWSVSMNELGRHTNQPGILKVAAS